MGCPGDLTCILFCVQGSTIMKMHICAVLDMGETSLRQAEEGNQLVQLYGEGGACEAWEVMDEIAK